MSCRPALGAFARSVPYHHGHVYVGRVHAATRLKLSRAAACARVRAGLDGWSRGAHTHDTPPSFITLPTHEVSLGSSMHAKASQRPATPDTRFFLCFKKGTAASPANTTTMPPPSRCTCNATRFACDMARAHDGVVCEPCTFWQPKELVTDSELRRGIIEPRPHSILAVGGGVTADDSGEADGLPEGDAEGVRCGELVGCPSVPSI